MKQGYLRNFVVFIVSILLVWQTPGFAEQPASKLQAAASPPEPVALVVWTKGLLKALQPDQPARILTRRSPIYVQDTIITGKNDGGQIVFTDQSMVSLRANTALKIAAYKFRKGDEKQPDEEYVLDLAKGGFRTITGLIPKDNPKAYKIKTPAATIGVRGTELAVLYGQTLQVGIFQGEAIINNAAGEIFIAQDSPNVFATVSSNNQLAKTSANIPTNFLNFGASVIETRYQDVLGKPIPTSTPVSAPTSKNDSPATTTEKSAPAQAAPADASAKESAVPSSESITPSSEPAISSGIAVPQEGKTAIETAPSGPEIAPQSGSGAGGGKCNDIIIR